MESTYLKERLAKLATLRADSERIGSNEHAEAERARLKGGITDNPYPSMVGELMGRCWLAQFDIEGAQRFAERLEVIEREYERLISIFEALDIDLDEETLSTLELIGEDVKYKAERRSVRTCITQICSDVQTDERRRGPVPPRR